MNIKINDDLADLLLEYLRTQAGKEYARGKRSVEGIVDAILVDFINGICVENALDHEKGGYCRFHKLSKMYDEYLTKYGK